MQIDWRYFSLVQVNSRRGPEWKVWDHPEDDAGRGLWAFRAAEAARRQGEAVFETYHAALFKAKHEDGRDIAVTGTLVEMAREVGLDLARFEEDLRDRRLLARLARDHTEAVERLGIFGTPTLVFPGGGAVFLKLASVPPSSDSLAVFDEVRRMAQRTYILEMKKPQS